MNARLLQQHIGIVRPAETIGLRLFPVVWEAQGGSMERIVLKGGEVLILRRTLNPGDAGRIVSFHGEVYAREHGMGPMFEGYVAVTVGEFAQRQGGGNTKEQALLISREGAAELIGCCAVIDAGDQAAQFRWFLVDTPWRGLGLGRQLLRRAIEFARTCGYRRVFLYTGDFLPEAAGLYLSEGFILTESHPFAGWELHFTEQKYELDL